MQEYTIAIDLGTSAFRAQGIELPSGEIVSTTITTHHPLPGSNVMDHLHFTLELGSETAAGIMVRGINCLIKKLHIPLDRVIRVVVCGNPIQLSLLQGMEIRDLAYAGTVKLESMGVIPPKRDSAIIKAQNIPGLLLPEDCELIIPPAISHEVGADALAMIIRTEMLQKNETALAIDYGTNAEIALIHQGRVFTGSTAAGPAIEGQQLSCGMLAAPGSLSDLELSDTFFRMIMLDKKMNPVDSALVSLKDNSIIESENCPLPSGITGTGIIAIIHQAIEAGLISLPRITTGDKQLHLGKDLFLTEEDLIEAGKAFGAIRAGYITLCHKAGISIEEIKTMYMSGATGTYVDPEKARMVGLIPPRTNHINQMGNTSLAMAKELSIHPDRLAGLDVIAEKLRDTHYMFGTSQTFKKIYILELAYWTEGMPMSLYRDFLKRYGLPDLLEPQLAQLQIHKVQQDSDDSERTGLTVIHDAGKWTSMHIEGCTYCMNCVRECPAHAISVNKNEESGRCPVGLILNDSICMGAGCRHCEEVCPVGVFELNSFFKSEGIWPCLE